MFYPINLAVSRNGVLDSDTQFEEIQNGDETRPRH